MVLSCDQFTKMTPASRPKAQVFVERQAEIGLALGLLQQVPHADLAAVFRAAADLGCGGEAQLPIGCHAVRGRRVGRRHAHDLGVLRDRRQALRGQVRLAAITPRRDGIQRQVAKAHAALLAALDGHQIVEDAVASFKLASVGRTEDGAAVQAQRCVRQVEGHAAGAVEDAHAAAEAGDGLRGTHRAADAVAHHDGQLGPRPRVANAAAAGRQAAVTHVDSAQRALQAQHAVDPQTGETELRVHVAAQLPVADQHRAALVHCFDHQLGIGQVQIGRDSPVASLSTRIKVRWPATTAANAAASVACTAGT